MKKHKKIYKLLLMVLVIVLVTGCEKIDNVDFNSMCLKCGEDVFFPAYLVKLCANIIQFIQLIVPVIIIVVGMIDLFRAVIASDEKKMAEAKDSVIRKVIAGVMIFLIVAVVRFAFTAIPDFNDGDIDAMECMANFINGVELGEACPKRIDGNPKSVRDNESGANMSAGEDDEEEKGTRATCHDITDKTECLNKGCSYDTNAEECSPYGEKAEKKCYKCEKGSNTSYRWSYGNPDKKNCALVSGVSVEEDCKEHVAEGKKTCWKCESGSHTSYHWQVNKPSNNCAELPNIDSLKDCQEGKQKTAASKLCWDCYHADTKEHRYYFMEKVPDDEKKNKCTSSKISETECSKKSSIIIVDE